MNDHLKLSSAGANLIKHFESCLRKTADGKHAPYRCPANILTIAWGHTNHHGRSFDESSRWSQAECDEVFLEDMAGFEKAVRRLVKVELKQHQYDALVSFVFNVGEGALAKSTLLKKLNEGDFWAAALEFRKWNKGGGKILPGLVRRRASEALLFQNIPDRNYDGKPDKTVADFGEEMPQAVDEPA